MVEQISDAQDGAGNNFSELLKPNRRDAMILMGLSTASTGIEYAGINVKDVANFAKKGVSNKLPRLGAGAVAYYKKLVGADDGYNKIWSSFCTAGMSVARSYEKKEITQIKEYWQERAGLLATFSSDLKAFLDTPGVEEFFHEYRLINGAAHVAKESLKMRYIQELSPALMEEISTGLASSDDEVVEKAEDLLGKLVPDGYNLPARNVLAYCQDTAKLARMEAQYREESDKISASRRALQDGLKYLYDPSSLETLIRGIPVCQKGKKAWLNIFEHYDILTSPAKLLATMRKEYIANIMQNSPELASQKETIERELAEIERKELRKTPVRQTSPFEKRLELAEGLEPGSLARRVMDHPGFVTLSSNMLDRIRTAREEAKSKSSADISRS